ncbi:MAG TPA: hypothetical protein VE737_03590 [Actinomycetota bacterium]|nr:hypothetical protein [Actinomycetota bacterium]
MGLEGDEIVIGTLPEQRKLANMRRDPRVAVVIQTRNLNPTEAWAPGPTGNRTDPRTFPLG